MKQSEREKKMKRTEKKKLNQNKNYVTYTERNVSTILSVIWCFTQTHTNHCAVHGLSYILYNAREIRLRFFH